MSIKSDRLLGFLGFVLALAAYAVPLTALLLFGERAEAFGHTELSRGCGLGYTDRGLCANYGVFSKGRYIYMITTLAPAKIMERDAKIIREDTLMKGTVVTKTYTLASAGEVALWLRYFSLSHAIPMQDGWTQEGTSSIYCRAGEGGRACVRQEQEDNSYFELWASKTAAFGEGGKKFDFAKTRLQRTGASFTVVSEDATCDTFDAKGRQQSCESDNGLLKKNLGSTVSGLPDDHRQAVEFYKSK